MTFAHKITPLGIDYLTDNSFLNKAKDFLKDIKAIVPFV
ncbi:YjcQ family protein [Peptoniphilus equinus]